MGCDKAVCTGAAASVLQFASRASRSELPSSSPSCWMCPSAQPGTWTITHPPAHLPSPPPPQEIDALFHDAKYSARLLAEQADKYIS